MRTPLLPSLHPLQQLVRVLASPVEIQRRELPGSLGHSGRYCSCASVCLSVSRFIRPKEALLPFETVMKDNALIRTYIVYVCVCVWFKNSCHINDKKTRSDRHRLKKVPLLAHMTKDINNIKSRGLDTPQQSSATGRVPRQQQHSITASGVLLSPSQHNRHTFLHVPVNTGFSWSGGSWREGPSHQPLRPPSLNPWFSLFFSFFLVSPGDRAAIGQARGETRL